MPPPTLLFVYNAEAGRLHAALDLLHKTLSPGTYACALCALTHGVRMRPEWKAFLRELPLKARFQHRDEFWAEFPELRAYPLPAVFHQLSSGALAPFITAQELQQADLPALMRLVRARLAGLAGT